MNVKSDNSKIFERLNFLLASAGELLYILYAMLGGYCAFEITQILIGSVSWNIMYFWEIYCLVAIIAMRLLWFRRGGVSVWNESLWTLLTMLAGIISLWTFGNAERIYEENLFLVRTKWWWAAVLYSMIAARGYFNVRRVLNGYYKREYFDRGEACFRNDNDYDGAISNYSEAIRIDPNYVLAYCYRALAHSRKDDYDRTLADLSEAIRIAPNSADEYHNRGMMYWYFKKAEDYDRAIADFSEAIRLDPNGAGASYRLRGDLYQSKGDIDRAIADYSEAIRLNPDDAIAYNNRGWTYCIKGDLDQAIADANEAIRLDPKFAYAYDTRGFAYEKKGETDRAIADYEAALRINPDHATSKEGLNRVQGTGGQGTDKVNVNNKKAGD